MGLESSSSSNTDLMHRPIHSLFQVEAYSQRYNKQTNQSNKHGFNTHSMCRSPRLDFLECHKHTLIKYLQAVKRCDKKGFN